MIEDSSRRKFLVAGIGVPALLAARPQAPAKPAAVAASPLRGAPTLDYRVLGKTGLKVTTVGFGTMITSDPSVIERAADLGVNYFDTARGYQSGNCERMVGAALRTRRNKVFLSTKSGAPTKEQALADLDTSLREIGTDHVDIWYLHGKSKPEDLKDELIEAQQLARKAGKIRFAGVSTHGGQKDLVPAIVARRDHFDVLLTTYNFAMDPAIADSINLAADAGLGVVAMKVMAGGERALRANPNGDRIRGILHRDGGTLAALKWVLRNTRVHTTIPSTTDMDQLDENLRAMAAPFGAADEKTLETRLELLRPHYCNMCGQCDGTCARGLPVADMLRFYMYSANYGEFPLGLESFRQLPAHLQSVRCSECPECTVSCPRGVRVAERLSLAQECFG
ncbi:MAG: aldo/keto reductase [Bryobacteraceae bacterium]|jgi:aryl-alcohol dehydrogenase-like predicted oxidoreductase